MLENQALMKLQNGSDVRGVAVAGVPGEDVNLFPEAVHRIARGYVAFLAAKVHKQPEKLQIAVGHDSRISAPELKQAVLQALAAEGVKAYDCGLASTPAMFMSIVLPETKMDGALMLTASHLPYNRNGLKFFTRDGGLEHEEVTQVLQLACGKAWSREQEAQATDLDLISLYAAHLRKQICQGIKASDYEHPLAGLHIVVDAGNGAGGFFVTKVLEVLGANTAGSLFLEPDGHFPNHIPNPENQAAMDAIKGAVLSNQADLGIIFDTDVDRMSAVLASGEQISRNALIAMMAAVLAPAYPGSTIITDSVTSDELTQFLEGELHLKHHRFKRGYKNVIDECIRFNKEGTVSPLAIETSGHGALSENYYLDDGAYLAVKLLIAGAKMKKQGQDLSLLIAKLGYPAESKEYRLKIKAKENFKAYGNQVLAAFETRALAAGLTLAEPSYEGIRVVFPGGWALLRLSLHDPTMPLNVEGKHPGELAKITAELRKLLAGFTELDTTTLEQ